MVSSASTARKNSPPFSHWIIAVQAGQNKLFNNPLPTIRNSLKKQKSLYEVLTPSIKTPIKIHMGLWELTGHILVGKELREKILE